jgi:hypothetical protein
LKFILFVEGYTERKALPDFIKRWIDPQLTKSVGIKVVRFEGWSDYQKDVAKKVNLHLEGPGGADIVGAIGLIDLYGPTFYPGSHTTVQQRLTWAKKYFANLVNNSRFRQHFAVHETEAWLLSDPKILPVKMPTGYNEPETVNFDQPPARLLDKLYRAQLKRPYKKVVDGNELFGNLSPQLAAAKCVRLNEMLVDMLQLAKMAGL